MPKTTEELYRELLAKGDAAQQQANDLLTEYDNRAAFAYDPNADGSFQALKNQYVHQGRKAMEDTMGQAANLTGGYNSSYSQSVGNQAYDEYLTNLNAQIPALAQQARAAYDAEGQRMLDRYNLALNAANTAYSQGRDALGDLRYEQEWAQQQKAYEDDLAYRQWQQSQTERGDAYDRAMTWIQMGLMPDDATLNAAGINKAQAQAAVNKAQQQYVARSAGGSGRKGSSYSRRSRYGDLGKEIDETDTATDRPKYTDAERKEAYTKVKYYLNMSAKTGDISYATRAIDYYADYLTDDMAAEVMSALDRLSGKKNQSEEKKKKAQEEREKKRKQQKLEQLYPDLFP